MQKLGELKSKILLALKSFYQTMGFRNIAMGLVFGIILVAGGVVGYLHYLDSNLSVKEAAVTNITDTGFTLTWVSDSQYEGKVYYQQGAANWPKMFAQAGKNVAYDDRDVEVNDKGDYILKKSGAKKRYTHHVTIRGLKPETKYSLRIGGMVQGRQPDIKEFYTLAIQEDLKTPNPAYGKIDGVSKTDAIITIIPNGLDGLKVPGMISTTVADNGTYSIDLNYFKLNSVDAKKLQAVIRSDNKSVEPYNFTKSTYKPLETINVSFK